MLTYSDVYGEFNKLRKQQENYLFSSYLRWIMEVLAVSMLVSLSGVWFLVVLFLPVYFVERSMCRKFMNQIMPEMSAIGNTIINTLTGRNDYWVAQLKSPCLESQHHDLVARIGLVTMSVVFDKKRGFEPVFEVQNHKELSELNGRPIFWMFCTLDNSMNFFDEIDAFNMKFNNSPLGKR